MPMNRFDGFREQIQRIFKRSNNSKSLANQAFQPPPPSQAKIDGEILRFIKERPIHNVGLSDYSEAIRDLFLEMGISESFKEIEDIIEPVGLEDAGSFNEVTILINDDGSFNEFGTRLIELRFNDRVKKRFFLNSLITKVDPPEGEMDFQWSTGFNSIFLPSKGFHRLIIEYLEKGVISRYEALAELFIYNASKVQHSLIWELANHNKAMGLTLWGEPFSLSELLRNSKDINSEVLRSRLKELFTGPEPRKQNPPPPPPKINPSSDTKDAQSAEHGSRRPVQPPPHEDQ